MAMSKSYKHDHLVKNLEDANTEAVYGCTFCKRPVTVQLKIENNVIVDAGGIVDGCEYSRQCLGTLLDMAKGLDVDQAWYIAGNEVKERLEVVNPKLDCETYVLSAFKLALRNWERKAA